MAETTTPAASWKRLAAPDRHPPRRPVTLPLFPLGGRRPASTMHDQETARAAVSTI